MKGISAMIATVLVVAFTVAVGAILATWFTGITRTTTAGTETQSQAIIKCVNSGFDIPSAKINSSGGQSTIYISKSSSDVKIYPKSIVFSDGSVNTGFSATPSYMNSTTTLSTITISSTPTGITWVRVNALCEYGSYNQSIDTTCRSGENCWKTI